MFVRSPHGAIVRVTLCVPNGAKYALECAEVRTPNNEKASPKAEGAPIVRTPVLPCAYELGEPEDESVSFTDDASRLAHGGPRRS
jgi:hypothetical protein